MTNPKILKWRLPVLLLLLICLEAVNLVKLSTAMSWTNGNALGVVAAICMGCFLVGSIVATSFGLSRQEKTRLEWYVFALFGFQTALVAIVSYLYSLILMPAAEVAALFNTEPELTRKVVAVAEGIATNLGALAFWGVLAEQWRKEIEDRDKSYTWMEKLEQERSESNAR